MKLGGKFAHLQDDAQWEAFCEKLAATEWVSFIQPPPTPSCSADQVVRYLSRYLTGGPISDSRIVAADAEEVTFLAREGKLTGGERRQVPVTLATTEFIRRWCNHIQPDQLTKTRYFGGWSSQKRTAYLARCKQLLEQAETDLNDDGLCPTNDRLSDDQTADAELPRCPHCDEPALRLIRESAKPSWSDVLNHLDPRCPKWYGELDFQEHCRYLMETYGVDYEDWYLETQVESAMKPALPPPPPIQLYFPGMYPARDFLIESF